MNLTQSKAELIGRINAARRTILVNGGNQVFSVFVQSKYGNKAGFSKSNITKMLKVIEEAEEKDVDLLKDYLRKIEEFEEAVQKFERSRKGNSILFFDTKWYLYFFYYHPFMNQDAMLGRAVLKIDSQGDVTIINIEDGASTDYKGRFELINDYVMFFDLEGNSPSSKLHLKILTGRQPNQVSLGISLSFEHQSVTSGTVVMEHQKPDVPLKSGRYVYRDPEFTKIPLPIRKYLSLKWQNYLKVPQGVRTYEDLKNFMTRYQTNKSRYFFQYNKPTVFISTPTDSILDKDYDHQAKKEAVIDIINQVDNILKKNEIELDFIYPGRQNEKTTKDLQEYRKSTVTNMETLKHTKFFILIYDKHSVSKSLVELGWALAHCKVILVFYKRGEGFPEGLSSFEFSEQFRYFKMEPFNGKIQDEKEFIQTRILHTIVESLLDLKQIARDSASDDK